MRKAPRRWLRVEPERGEQSSGANAPTFNWETCTVGMLTPLNEITSLQQTARLSTDEDTNT